MIQALRKKGNVLVAVDTAGRTLELIQLLVSPPSYTCAWWLRDALFAYAVGPKVISQSLGLPQYKSRLDFGELVRKMKVGV